MLEYHPTALVVLLQPLSSRSPPSPLEPPAMDDNNAPTALPTVESPPVPAAVTSSGEAGGAAVAETSATVPSTRKARTRKPKTKKPPAATAGVPPTERKLAHLVIDSGAIIKGAGMTLVSAAEVCSCVFFVRMLELSSVSGHDSYYWWWWWL